MVTTTEGQFQIGSLSCYTKTWTPDGPVKAKVLFWHGFSDHCGRYDDFWPKVATRGIQVLGIDQRGWGHTVKVPSDWGVTGDTPQVLSDMAAFMRDNLPSEVPVFLGGHSMGGGQLLWMAGDAQYRELIAQARGVFAESPLVGFAPDQEPSKIKRTLGKLAARVLPRFQIKAEVPPEVLSRRAVAVESLREDPLVPNLGSLQGLSGMIDRTEDLSTEGKVRLPRSVRSLFVAHGTADKVCSSERSAAFVSWQTEVEDKTLKLYEGGYHQIHADLEEGEYPTDLANWILERCGGEEPKIHAKL